jgi:hypothetical protein
MRQAHRLRRQRTPPPSIMRAYERKGLLGVEVISSTCGTPALTDLSRRCLSGTNDVKKRLSTDVSPVSLWFEEESAPRGIRFTPHMKKLVSLGNRVRPVAASVAFATAATLAVAFWFSTVPTGNAQAQCTVCHKRTTTLTFPCASLDYRRHLDHGDTMGACNMTPTENP